MEISQRIKFAIITYLFVCIILIQYPPVSLTNRDSYYFGVSNHKTILPFWLILVLVAFVCYFVSLFL